jgi:hypothetical protein
VALKIVEKEGFFRGLYEGFAFLVARQVMPCGAPPCIQPCTS